MRRCRTLPAFLAMWIAFPLLAQDEEVVRLELRDDPALADGQVAIVEGAVADQEGLRYTIRDLSILQPVTVTLLSPEENPTLEMSLHLSRWDEAVRTAALNGAVGETLKFRTQEGVGIKVWSPDGRPQRFDLVAWVGSEVEPEMEPVVVSDEQYKAFAAANPELYPAGAPGISDDGETNPVLVLIAVLLAGILVLLGILVFRR